MSSKIRTINPPLKYRIIKEIAINLASLGIPVSFYAGFLFGKEQWLWAFLAVGIYLIIDNIAGRLWFWVLEHISK